MEVRKNGTQPTNRGPEEYFTGEVHVQPLNNAPDPARVVITRVTFEPGARTAWHSHPFGQTLVVVAGSGRVGHSHGEVEEIHSGDVIWTPPGEKHWHGAAPTTSVTHLAIQEHLDGKTADWMEKVSDEEYHGTTQT